jgi:methyl-accepting chemotaxis protein WspA
MKTITLIQRLRTGFGGLCLAAIVVGTLIAWQAVRAVKRQLAAEALHRQVSVTVERMRLATLTIGYALRGVMLDPGNQAERNRKREADSELSRLVGELRPLIREHPELIRALEAVGDHDTTKLTVIEDQVMDLAAPGKDPARARVEFTESYLPARRVQEQLLTELEGRSRRLAAAVAVDWPRLALMVAAGLALLAAVAAFLARRTEIALANSLQVLWQGVDRLRSGVLNQPIVLPERNEFTILAESLNRLGAELGDLAVRLRESGGEVLTVNSGLGSALGACRQHLAELESLAANLHQASRRVLATSTELSHSIHSVSNVADQTAMLTDSSRLGLTRMGDTMQAIHRAADGINAKLGILNEKAANISQVITTMAKVADQTNLLSLNAAIEAEKAGEYGRGFAVVATEIQRLADQTAVAADDIEQMVREMQGAVTAGVMGMDKFADEVRRGVGEVQQVGGQLSRILQHVQAITPQIETINTAMQTQNESARQIADTARRFTDFSRATGDAQQQAQGAVDEFEAAARRMQEGAARFKLKT